MRAVKRPLTQAALINLTAFFIFSALSSLPNRDRLVSGRFTNGQVGVTRCFNFENTCRREAGTNPLRVLTTYIKVSNSLLIPFNHPHVVGISLPTP